MWFVLAPSPLIWQTENSFCFPNRAFLPPLHLLWEPFTLKLCFIACGCLTLEMTGFRSVFFQHLLWFSCCVVVVIAVALTCQTSDEPLQCASPFTPLPAGHTAASSHVKQTKCSFSKEGNIFLCQTLLWEGWGCFIGRKSPSIPSQHPQYLSPWLLSCLIIKCCDSSVWFAL